MSREIVGLVGESGSGKSTLARVIAGLYQPDSAQMVFAAEALPGIHRSPALRRRIQMVFQDPYSSLNPRMRVGQHLRELIRVHHLASGAAVDARCVELMGLVSLPSSCWPRIPVSYLAGNGSVLRSPGHWLSSRICSSLTSQCRRSMSRCKRAS